MRKSPSGLGDALIAQSCMDRGIPLLMRDRDFQAFAEATGLDLAIGPGRAEYAGYSLHGRSYNRGVRRRSLLISVAAIGLAWGAADEEGIWREYVAWYRRQPVSDYAVFG
jgi:hypothetical protein